MQAVIEIGDIEGFAPFMDGSWGVKWVMRLSGYDFFVLKEDKIV
jgi:hypothetical protein